MTYIELDAKLRGRCLQRRKLGNNTYAIRRLSTSHLWGGLGEITASIDILYHSTFILSFRPDGDITVDIGRWYTITTKQRLNKYLHGWSVWSFKGEWMVWRGATPIAIFNNGMVLHPNGTVTGAQSHAEWLEAREVRKKQNRAIADEKRVRCYVRIDDHFCNLYINAAGECRHHGYLPLPGEDA